MNRHFLTQEEYKQLIEKELYSKNIGNEYEDLMSIIESSKTAWNIELIGFNYFLSKVLEQYLKNGVSCEDIIEFIYSINQEMYFTVEEFDYKFIKHLFLNCLPDKNNLLSEDLIENHLMRR